MSIHFCNTEKIKNAILKNTNSRIYDYFQSYEMDCKKEVHRFFNNDAEKQNWKLLDIYVFSEDGNAVLYAMYIDKENFAAFKDNTGIDEYLLNNFMPFQEKIYNKELKENEKITSLICQLKISDFKEIDKKEDLVNFVDELISKIQ